MWDKNNKIIFTEGKIFYNKLQFYFIPLNSFIILIKEIIENSEKDKIKNIFHNAAKIDTEILYSQLSNKISIKDKINFFLEVISKIGMGDVKLKCIEKNKIIFISDNILSRTYYNFYQSKPSIPLEEIILGYIKYFLQNLLKKEIKIKISDKILKNKIIIECNILDNCYEIISQNNNYLDFSKNIIQNNVIKKITLNQHIMMKNGFLTIWNVGAIMIPCFFFIEVCSKLEKNKFEKIFEDLGIAQGYSAVDLQTKMFGVDQEPQTLFNQVIQQSELIGMGNTKILSYKNLEFNFINGIYTYRKFYENEEYFLLDIYFRNLIKGVYEKSYGEKTTMETINDISKLEKISNKSNLNKNQKEMFKYLTTKSLVKFY